MRIRILFAFLFVFVPLVGCSQSNSPASSQERGTKVPTVYTVNYPLYYFADRIGGSRLDLHFIAPGDGDPAFWNPSDEDVLKMQAADVLFLNGADYAKWLANVTLPPSILYNTSRSFSEDFITVKDASTHTHGDGKVHAHDGVAFTTWLDMSQAEKQAIAVRDILMRKVPGAEAELKKNAKALISDLRRLDKDLKKVSKSIGKKPLVASHPVYQYFSRRYSLEIESVHWEPEVVPDDKGMAALKKTLSNHPAKWMIWEGEPAADSVAKLKAIGVESLVFDPCGNRPEQGDWLSVMSQNVERLRAVSE